RDAPLGDPRLRRPDLLRLLRLQRPRHRLHAMVRLRTAGELQPAVSRVEHRRLLAALAYDPIAVDARLPLHLLGRQPFRRRPDLWQPAGDHDPLRPLAWGELELRALGLL